MLSDYSSTIPHACSPGNVHSSPPPQPPPQRWKKKVLISTQSSDKSLSSSVISSLSYIHSKPLGRCYATQSPYIHRFHGGLVALTYRCIIDPSVVLEIPRSPSHDLQSFHLILCIAPGILRQISDCLPGRFLSLHCHTTWCLSSKSGSKWHEVGSLQNQAMRTWQPSAIREGSEDQIAHRSGDHIKACLC